MVWRGRGRAGTTRRRDRTDLYGEVGGRTPDGFDFGNSPYEISGVDFRGQTLSGSLDHISLCWLSDLDDLSSFHCAICHGTAKGDPSASPVAKGLYPRPPQLATDGVENDPENFSFWKIKHGIRWTGMPSWKWTLTDQ
jgi:hypothetical protein